MNKSWLIISMSFLFVVGSFAYAQRDEDATKEGERDKKPEARQRDGEGDRPKRSRDGEATGRQRGPGDGEMRGRRQGPPPNPIMMALDANKDGELSADEISNAASTLKELDKNNDGKLSGEEIHPPRPPREGDRRRGGARDGEQKPEGDRPPRDGDRPPRERDQE